MSPPAPCFWLQDARVPSAALASPAARTAGDALAPLDILIDGDRIAAVGERLAHADAATPRLALGGAIVLPCFVDAHTHLDKGHIWPRAENRRRNFDDALATVAADRESNWSAADVAGRMEFSLRAAYAHGTRAIRTHIDSLGKQTRISWPVFSQMRERWRGRIELQASPLFGIDALFVDGHLADVEAMVEAHGSKLLGAVTYMIPRLKEALDILFRLAARKGWDLDFHADETGDPEARSLGLIAERALANKFEGRILVGHACSLAVQDEETRKRTLDAVARAGLAVVSLPMCNMFLQDREASRTPRWRGVTLLHELKAAGAETLIASDNTRDPFYAYGDLDMLEVWREGVRILHLDAPFDAWAESVLRAPARAAGLAGGVIGTGAPADLVVTQARGYTELFARPQSGRRVLRGGAFIDAKPPDYRELDDLKGLTP